MSKTIAIDFDGVIHSYTSRWVGETIIPDEPVPGAIDFIEECVNAGLKVCIFSTRNATPAAIDAIKAWLLSNGMSSCVVDCIRFPVNKPFEASIFIDDRAYLFEGSFPSIEYIKEFKPWNKR